MKHSDKIVKITEWEEDGIPYTAVIRLVDQAKNPRQWRQYGRLALTHGRYNLPWEVDIVQNPDSLRYRTAEPSRHGFKSVENEVTTWEQFDLALRQEYAAWNNPIVYMVGVFMLDHSGLVVVLGNTDPFGDTHMGLDSGRIGTLFLTHDDIVGKGHRLTKEKRKKYIEVAKGEFNLWAAYIEGSVYEGQLFRNDDEDDSIYSAPFYSSDNIDDAIQVDLQNEADWEWDIDIHVPEFNYYHGGF